MAVKFHRAQRKKAKLRLGIAGPAGSGKTYSALQMAFGLGGPVAMIDTPRPEQWVAKGEDSNGLH